MLAHYNVLVANIAAFEDNFCKVYKEVIDIKPNYYEFGILLGLPPQEMNAVQKAFRQDIPQAFIEVLQIFLKHRYNIQEYGPPTWRKLVEAVDSPAGGNNHALAKKIAEHHPVNEGGGNDQPKMAEISACVHDGKHAYNYVGVSIGFIGSFTIGMRKSHYLNIPDFYNS
jgi:hypothetical protein